MSLVQTIIFATPLCDAYKKYTLIEWERCVFAKCRAPLKNATQCLSSRLSPVEKNSGGEEGHDDFGATTKQPRPRATRLLKRLCRLRMFYARFATNSKGFWSKHIIAIASSRACSSARTWRVLAMSKILWTKQRLVAGRTLSQLVEGWLYCVVYPYFGVWVCLWSRCFSTVCVTTKEGMGWLFLPRQTVKWGKMN